MLYAANDLPKFSMISTQHAESWSDGLQKVRQKRSYTRTYFELRIPTLWIYIYFAGEHQQLLPIDPENGAKK